MKLTTYLLLIENNTIFWLVDCLDQCTAQYVQVVFYVYDSNAALTLYMLLSIYK